LDGEYGKNSKNTYFFCENSSFHIKSPYAANNVPIKLQDVFEVELSAMIKIVTAQPDLVISSLDLKDSSIINNEEEVGKVLATLNHILSQKQNQGGGQFKMLINRTNYFQCIEKNNSKEVVLIHSFKNNMENSQIIGTFKIDIITAKYDIPCDGKPKSSCLFGKQSELIIIDDYNNDNFNANNQSMATEQENGHIISNKSAAKTNKNDHNEDKSWSTKTKAIVFGGAAVAGITAVSITVISQKKNTTEVQNFSIDGDDNNQ
jgi:hypothetical protein